MTDTPNIAWPEDGLGGAEVIAATRNLLGDHAWLALVPNPCPHTDDQERMVQHFLAAPIPVGNTVAFCVDGTRAAEHLETMFVWGPPEWAVVGFAEKPAPADITAALAAPDGRPAERLLVFDSNRLMTCL